MRNLLLLLLSTSIYGQFSIPKSNGYISDANHCLAELRNRLNLSHAVTRTLAGVVGVGYDDLQDVSTYPIFAANFSKCETTPDGQFLVPDDWLVVPIFNTKLDRLASYYKDFHEVDSTLKRTTSLKSSAKFKFASVSGSFSSEYQETKQNMYGYESSMLVTRLTYEAYTVVADLVSSPLTAQFRSRILDVAYALQKGLKQRADYLAQLLVKDYGTHVLLKSKTGAIIQQETYIDSSTSFTSKASLATTRAAASASFLSQVAVGTHADTTKQVSEVDKRNLSQITTHTLLRSKGGSSVERLVGGVPSSSNSFTVDNVVSFESDGLPLYELVVFEHFPQFDHAFILDLRAVIDKAIDAYYEHNTIRGCMNDPTSSNWNYAANVDDGSCHPNNNTYPLGGIFQLCQTLSELPGSSHEQSTDHPSNCTDESMKDNCAHMTPAFRCADLTQKNLYTGDFTCPANYVHVQIASIVTKFPDRLEKHSKRSCKRHLFHKKCHDEYWTVTYKDQVKLTSYYCIKDPNPNKTLPAGSGTLFGGLYKIGSVNMFTNKEGCPGLYSKYRLAGDIIVCLSRNYAADARYGVPFGGFFSCQTPESSRRCPAGFSQFLASVEDNCEIYYCIKTDYYRSLTPPAIKSPPYIDEKLAQTNVSYSVIQAFANDTMILRIPVITIANAVIPKIPFVYEKATASPGKVQFTNAQVVAAVAHFKSNTYEVLSRIVADEPSYEKYLNYFSEDDVDINYDVTKDIYANIYGTENPNFLGN